VTPAQLRALCDERGFTCYYNRTYSTWYVLGDAGRGPETVWFGSSGSLRATPSELMRGEMDRWERNA
jgi:hypothetical protein